MLFLPAFISSHNKTLQPVWCCLDAETEVILASEFRWNTLTAVAKDEVNSTEADPKKHGKNLRKMFHNT